MKKILLLSAFPPSKYSAGQNFTLNLLNDLSKEHTIDFVYFAFREQSYTSSSQQINVIKKIPLSPANRIINVILCPFFHPLFSVRFSLPTLLLLKKLVRTNSYDIICFDFSQVFLYSLFFRREKKVLIAHDVIVQKSAREGFASGRWWAGWTERRLFRQKNIQVFTFSGKDKALINVHAPDTPVSVINFYLSPNILDLPLRFSDDRYFCFFAAWNRPENHEGLQWFIDEILPHVSSTRFMIVGANMPESLAERIKAMPNVEYAGFVDNPYTILANARALIAPLFKGAGVKVKVIESLACGTPVIGTEVALEGVEDVVEDSLIRCNNADGFIRAIVNFNIDNEHKVSLRQTFIARYTDETKRVRL